jgi:hypothetical protein
MKKCNRERVIWFKGNRLQIFKSMRNIANEFVVERGCKLIFVEQMFICLLLLTEHKSRFQTKFTTRKDSCTIVVHFCRHIGYDPCSETHYMGPTSCVYSCASISSHPWHKIYMHGLTNTSDCVNVVQISFFFWVSLYPWISFL